MNKQKYINEAWKVYRKNSQKAMHAKNQEEEHRLAENIFKETMKLLEDIQCLEDKQETLKAKMCLAKIIQGEFV